MLDKNPKLFYRFVGKRPAIYGGMGIAVGFVLFAFDLALATMLQRFFMATGLITLGTDMPLGIDLQTPLIEATVLVLIGVLRASTIWANGFFSGLCQITFETEKRNELTKWAIYDGMQENGVIMSYYNDIISGAAVAVWEIFFQISRIVILGGLFLVMLGYSTKITYYVILIILFIAPIQILIDRLIVKHADKIQKSMMDSVSFLSRSIKNNLFISLHNFASHEIDNIRQSIGIYKNSKIIYTGLSSFRSVFPQVLGLLTVSAIAIQGSTLFSANPSIMVAYLYLVLRFFQVLSDAARVSGSLRLNYPRISILYEWWTKYINFSCGNNPVIASDNRLLVGWNVQNLSFAWPNGHQTAIDDLSFNISPASTTLIIGASGSGKTTLFQILLGLLKPTNGDIVYIDAVGHETRLEGRLPYCISYVGPDPFLIAGSIRDQLLIGNQPLTDDELVAVLRLVQADFVFDFADGLNHSLTEQGIGLSAGQKQRLALARAILRQPSVLLLDEATANLDEVTERLIIEQVNCLHKKMTILVISHRPHKDLIVDNIIELRPLDTVEVS